MANELTLDLSTSYSDSEGSELAMALVAKAVTLASKKFIHHKHNVGTAEEAMELGELSALGYCIAINRDVTNFVEIRVGTGGTKIVKIPAGEGALFRFGSGVTAPFVIADTGACQLEYIIFST